MWKRILVPIDFSRASLAGLDYAVDLGRKLGSELILVHAVERIDYAGASQVYGAAALVRQFAQTARQRLTSVAARLGTRHLRVRTVLQIGTAHEVITTSAKRLKVDLIVLSTHGRTGLAHVFLGSVAEKVVRHAGCAVLTVRGLEPKGRRSAKPSPARRKQRTE